jgi:hypothetical protein
MLASIHVGSFFFRREQIKKQRCQPGLIQRSRNELIARTVPAAPAPVRKENKCNRILWSNQISGEHCAPSLNLHLVH